MGKLLRAVEVRIGEPGVLARRPSGASRSSGRRSGSPSSGRRRCRSAGRAGFGSGLRVARLRRLGDQRLRRQHARHPGEPRRAPRCGRGTRAGAGSPSGSLGLEPLGGLGVGELAAREPRGVVGGPADHGSLHHLAVVDAVLDLVDDRDVAAGAAVDLVGVAVAGVDPVAPRAGELDAVAHVEAVAAAVAVQRVGAAAADQHVAPAAADQHVAARAGP